MPAWHCHDGVWWHRYAPPPPQTFLRDRSCCKLCSLLEMRTGRGTHMKSFPIEPEEQISCACARTPALAPVERIPGFRTRRAPSIHPQPRASPGCRGGSHRDEDHALSTAGAAPCRRSPWTVRRRRWPQHRVIPALDARVPARDVATALLLALATVSVRTGHVDRVIHCPRLGVRSCPISDSLPLLHTP